MRVVDKWKGVFDGERKIVSLRTPSHDSMNVLLARIMKRSLVGFKHLVTRTIKLWLLVAKFARFLDSVLMEEVGLCFRVEN